MSIRLFTNHHQHLRTSPVLHLQHEK
jgi:hypothetical protein